MLIKKQTKFLFILLACSSFLNAGDNRAILLSFTGEAPCQIKEDKCAPLAVGEYISSDAQVKLKSGLAFIYDSERKERLKLEPGLHAFQPINSEPPSSAQRLENLVKISQRNTASSMTRGNEKGECQPEAVYKDEPLWLAKCRLQLPVAPGTKTAFPALSNYQELPVNPEMLKNNKLIWVHNQQCLQLNEKSFSELENSWREHQRVVFLVEDSLRWQLTEMHSLGSSCATNLRQELTLLQKTMMEKDDLRLATSDLLQSFGLYFDAIQSLSVE